MPPISQLNIKETFVEDSKRAQADLLPHLPQQCSAFCRRGVLLSAAHPFSYLRQITFAISGRCQTPSAADRRAFTFALKIRPGMGGPLHQPARFTWRLRPSFIHKKPLPGRNRKEALVSFYAPVFPEGSALNRTFYYIINTNVFHLRRLSRGAFCRRYLLY